MGGCPPIALSPWGFCGGTPDPRFFLREFVYFVGQFLEVGPDKLSVGAGSFAKGPGFGLELPPPPWFLER